MTDRTVTVHLRAEVASYLSRTLAAEKGTKRLRDEVERLDKASHVLTRAGLLAGIAGLPGLLAPAGAAIAALPGLTLGAASSFGVLAVATNGVGDAMKAVGEGDAAKLQKALVGLSDEARRFIGEYQRVRPILARMGDRTQDAFFHELLGDMDQMTRNYLPTMMNQIPKLASQLGKAGSELATWASSPQTVAKMNKQFELAAETTDDWGRLLRNTLALILDLADAGSDFNAGFVDGLADGTATMVAWVAKAKQQGSLNRMFENGSRILSKLGDIAAQVAELLFDMMANPALTDAAMSLLDLLGMTLDVVHALLAAFSALPAPMQSVVATILAVGGAALLLAGRVAAMKSALAGAALRLDGMGVSGERAARGLERGAKWAGRAAAAFVGLQIIGTVARTMRGASADVDTLSNSLERFGDTATKDSALLKVFGQDYELLQHDLKRAALRGLDDVRGGASIEGIFGDIPSLFTDKSDSLTLDRLTQLDTALANLARSGNTDAAVSAFARLRKEAAALGIDESKLLAILPQYASAVEQGATATKELAAAKQVAAMNAVILKDGLLGAVREAGSLKAAFDRLNGAAITFAEAEIDAEVAIDRFTEGLAENGRTMDVTTAKGQENKRNLLGIVNAASLVAQAQYDKTLATKGEAAALVEANRAYQNYIAQTRAAMIATGMAAAQVDLLLGEYAQLPAIKATQVQIFGVEDVLWRLRQIRNAIENLPSGSVTANLSSGAYRGYREGGITPIHARAGLLSQPNIFNAGSRPLYAFAEPETKQEAFVPRNGDKARALGILDQASRWYGHTIMPTGGSAGGGGGGTMTIVHEHRHTVTLNGTSVLSGIRQSIELNGGSAENHLGRRRRNAT